MLEAEDGATWIDLVCIGYKYNKKKVLTFVLSKGAGLTLEGVPYEARFPDIFGNVCIYHVSRPQVVSNHFKYCNMVDLHNQVRQFNLALEKKWVTQNVYFRLYYNVRNGSDRFMEDNEKDFLQEQPTVYHHQVC